MSSFSSSTIYTNTFAASFTYHYETDFTQAQAFHKTLPHYSTTPLVSLPALATELGVKAVFVKNESKRFSLPAFKILGASWGVYRAICANSNPELTLDTPISNVGRYAQEQGLVLYAATDGNHGRAVARMAGILGVRARIYVPRFTDEETRGKIESEGAEVVGVQGDYDAAAARAWEDSRREGEGRGVLVQDNAFDGYMTIPLWIVEGYSTMMAEIESQLAEQGLKASAMVTPIGVGGLGHAVVAHCKSQNRGISVLAIEPESAGCLHASLKAGRPTTIETGNTIMDGMCCGTVSPTSWDVLRKGVDASVLVTDGMCHEAVGYLHEEGVMAGPCGAGSLAGLRQVAKEDRAAIGLDADSVIVLLCTEGKRGYIVPESG